MRLPFLQHAIGRGGDARIILRQCGEHHRQFVRVGADRLQIVVHREQHVGRSDETAAQPLLQRLDAPALPQEAMPAARAEVGDDEVGQVTQPLDLVPQQSQKT